MYGYMHPEYAYSLAEFGAPRLLPRCGGWILERQIPGFSNYDAMGCYPLFCCQDWSQLHTDLDNLGPDLVSLGFVTDPFGNYDEAYLRRCFSDKVIPFKQHYVIDLKCPVDSFVSSHHYRNVRKALQDVQVEQSQQPLEFLDDWAVLYRNLIERHNIKGLSAFSKSSFAKQLAVPGLVMFRALHQGTTVGMILWYTQGDVGYYHLAAYTEMGYTLRTSFALFWTAIQFFADQGLRWLNLGAGAGLKSGGTDGLSRFKQGWSTDTRNTYFCGRIFNPEKYDEIVRAKNISETNYFPAYRQGEFG